MDQVKHIFSAIALLLILVVAAGLTWFISAFETSSKKSGYATDSYQVTTPTFANEKGYSVYQQNCASCHALYKTLTGPALSEVETRGPWTDRKQLIKWVKNPAIYIPTNSYTITLQKQFGQIMPAFPSLTEEQINDIFDYIKKVEPVAY
jgi:mono/diheme cytochrome c family protein